MTPGHEPTRAGSAQPRAAARVGTPTVVHITTVPFELPLFLAGQAAFIRRAGFRLHAIASPGPDLVAFAAKEQVSVHGIPMTRKITPVQDVRALWHLWRTLRSIAPEIVHSHSPKGGLLGMIAAWLARTPVRIYHIRGLPLATATGLRRYVLRWSERTSCALAHTVLAVSHSMRTMAIEERLVAERKIKVLQRGSGNGVDATTRFRPPDEAARVATRAEYAIPANAPVIGFVGRICRDKGIVELAQAWSRVREDEPRARLLLVGSVDDDVLADRALEALHRDPHVIFTGETRDTPRLYGVMDIVALPSYREGFPNVALEAAAMAVPLVTTSVPGCIDAVEDGVTATLVPPRDATALAEALRRYLSDPALRSRHGQAARRRVLDQFQPESIWQSVVAEYDALLVAAGLPPAERGRERAV